MMVRFRGLARCKISCGNFTACRFLFFFFPSSLFFSFFFFFFFCFFFFFWFVLGVVHVLKFLVEFFLRACFFFFFCLLPFFFPFFFLLVFGFIVSFVGGRARHKISFGNFMTCGLRFFLCCGSWDCVFFFVLGYGSHRGRRSSFFFCFVLFICNKFYHAGQGARSKLFLFGKPEKLCLNRHFDILSSCMLIHNFILSLWSITYFLFLLFILYFIGFGYERQVTKWNIM